MHSTKWLFGLCTFFLATNSIAERRQSFLPGSHKLSRISSRFVRAPDGKSGTTFVPVDGVEPNEERWEELKGWREEPCKPGTLVLIHGKLDE